METMEQHVTLKINFDMFHDSDKAEKNEFFFYRNEPGDNQSAI